MGEGQAEGTSSPVAEREHSSPRATWPPANLKGLRLNSTGVAQSCLPAVPLHRQGLQEVPTPSSSLPPSSFQVQILGARVAQRGRGWPGRARAGLKALDFLTTLGMYCFPSSAPLSGVQGVELLSALCCIPGSYNSARHTVGAQ